MSFFSSISSFRSKPSDATFVASSTSDSSNDMKTPGSLKSVAPRTRNSMAKSVLPAPALPQISVGRPAGKPPRVISSKPEIPVRSLGKALRDWELRRFCLDTNAPPKQTETQTKDVKGESVRKGTKGKEFI